MEDPLAVFLERHGSFEPPTEGLKRQTVLGLLCVWFRDWVQQEAKFAGMPSSFLPGGKLLTFGSYRLGVHGPGADMDVLCVAPKHATRAAFFSTFAPYLASQPDVFAVQAVAEAYVPVLKCVIQTFHVDIVFAQLKLSRIPRNLDIQWAGHLQGVDPKTVLSLNGVRVTDGILALVPNRAVFRSVLRFIKIWASKRAIYSNVMGYLGGVSWAILTARICQLFPNLNPLAMVQKFFTFYSLWKWPSPLRMESLSCSSSSVDPLRIFNPRQIVSSAKIDNPLTPVASSSVDSALVFGPSAPLSLPSAPCSNSVVPTSRDPPSTDSVVPTRRDAPSTELAFWTNRDPPCNDLAVWSSRDHPNDLMPILTPAYPSMNSTYNVSTATLSRLKHEFKRAMTILSPLKSLPCPEVSCALGSVSSSVSVSGPVYPAASSQSTFPLSVLEQLTEKTDFFKAYKHFLKITVSAGDKDGLQAWSGLCESKIRHLVTQVSKQPSLQAFPFPKPFPNPTTLHSLDFFIALAFSQDGAASSKASDAKKKRKRSEVGQDKSPDSPADLVSTLGPDLKTETDPSTGKQVNLWEAVQCFEQLIENARPRTTSTTHAQGKISIVHLRRKELPLHVRSLSH